MISLTELARRIRYLIFRDRYMAELEEEIRLHIDLRAAKMRQHGMSAGEAHYAARRVFGHATTIQTRSREMWGLNLLDEVTADVRFALRRLRRRPGFSLATIAVAALGIGATTAVFSAIDAAMFRPLPFAEPSALVTLTNVNIPFDPGAGQRFPQSRHILDITDVAEMRDVFSSSGAFAAGGLNLIDPANPQRVRVGVVTPGFFPTLGARPQRGRTFDAAEGRPNGPHAVILSDALWRRRFGGADMVGKSIDLSGTRYTVAGIMEPGFSFPNESDLWIPMTVPTTFAVFAPFRGFLPSQVIARLAPGASVGTASARLLANWTRLMGPAERGKRSNLDDLVDEARVKGAAVPLQRDLLGDRQHGLVILLGATALLLLIACANVANLLLSDAAGRRREVALREVLGASRARITRQLLVESVLLAFIGAAVGVALAPTVLGVLRATMPTDLAGVAPAELDLRVLGFALLLAVATGLLFGIWPALFSTRTHASETLKSGGGLGATAGLGRARRVLITTELALTVMLLIGSGLMLRSLECVLSQDMGMNPEHVGTLELSLPRGKPPERRATMHAILDRLAGDPAIQSAAIVNDLPLRGGGGISLSIEIDGAPKPKSVNEMRFSRYLLASAGYFRALGIPLLRGRSFTVADDSSAPPVAVINATMAATWWPNTDALGKTFRFAGDSLPYTIVGIAADVRESTLEAAVRPQMYVSIDRQPPDNIALLARATLPPAVLLARMTDAVHAVDASQAVYNVRTMDAVVAKSIAPRRTNTTLIALFGALALALSAFGVYAVVSYSVTRRAREFGIRAALGATHADIAALVGKEMFGVVLLGVTLGLGGAWALAHVMAALLFQIDTHDGPSFIAVPLLLLAPSAIATLIPARRAMSVNPSEVMRAE